MNPPPRHSHLDKICIFNPAREPGAGFSTGQSVSTLSTQRVGDKEPLVVNTEQQQTAVGHNRPINHTSAAAAAWQ